MIELVTDLLLPIVMLWLASMEYRMRTNQDKINQVPDRKEVANLINDKLEATKVMQNELKEDIKRVEAKLDLLLIKSTHRQD